MILDFRFRILDCRIALALSLAAVVEPFQNLKAAIQNGARG